MNEFALSESRGVSQSVGADMVSSRQAQEVQAAMVIAQKFPRNPERSYQRIIQDCKRKTLAEKAVYVYPRGNETVSGPSIRLAETIARAWGNIDFGVIELENKQGVGSAPGESVIMSYCWDLETNTRVTKVFTVKHRRDTKKSSYNLNDQRDIYELTANQAARRLRACILGVIPADIVEAAVDECDRTMSGGEGPLIDRVRRMIVAFSEISVTHEMIEKRLGHKIDVTTEAELVQLRKIFNSIRDNFADRSEFFEVPGVDLAQKPAAPLTVQSIRDIKSEAGPTPDKPEAAQQASTSSPAQVEPAPEKGEWEKEVDSMDQPNEAVEREDLGKKINAERVRIGLTGPALFEAVKESFGKAPDQLSISQLRSLLNDLSQRPSKAKK